MYIPVSQRNKNSSSIIDDTEDPSKKKKASSVIPTLQNRGYTSVYERGDPDYKQALVSQQRYTDALKGAEEAQAEAKKANSFGGLLKNTIFGLPKAALQTGKDILQGTARSGGMVGLSLIGEDQLDESNASKFIFGDKPLLSVQGAIKKTQKDLEEMGVNTKATKALSPLLVVGSIGLDFFGGGGEKKGIEEIAQSIAKTRSATEIASHLKPFAKDATESELEVLSHSLQNVDNPAKVKTILEAFSKKEAPQYKPLFRGATEQSMLEDKGRGISFATDKEVAERFAKTDETGFPRDGKVGEYFLPPEAKVLDASKLTAEKIGADLNRENIIKFAREEGYDAVDLTKAIDPKLGYKPENEIRILNKDILKTKSEFTEASQAPKQIRQIKVPSKDIELSQDLQERQMMIEFKKEALDNSPLRSLLKYVARRGEFKGELPEATGKGKGTFSKKGDTLLEDSEAHYGRQLDSEEVRAEMSKFQKEKKDLEEEIRSFNEDKKKYLMAKKDEKALDKVGKEEALKTEREMEKAKTEAETKTRLAERKKAFDEGVQRMKDEETARIKRQEDIKKAFMTEAPEEIGLFQKLKNSLNPRGILDPKSRKAFDEWSRGRLQAREAGQKEFGKIGVPEKEGFDTILNYQAGKETPYSGKIKETFDGLFKEAKERAGLDIGYIKNYLPQVYKESPTEMRAKILDYLTDNGLSYGEAQMYLEGKPLADGFVKRLGLNPFFSKDRVFPDYKTAMEYGLTPKYTNPDQLAAHYRQNLEKTIADKKFIDTLIEDAKILPVESAPNSWKPVSLPFSQKGYYAEPKLAKFLNGVFDDMKDRGFVDTLFKVVADLSKKAQEIALSAGIPGTNVNFFSIGQFIKQITAGDFKAVSPFIRANFNKSSIKFFEKNQDIIQKMAGEGIDLGGRIGTYDKVYKNLRREWAKTPKNLGKKETYAGFYNLAGETFDKLFNEKTFGSFMPQLNIQTFKGAYKGALKKGMPEEEARKLAGDITKKMFGLVEDVGRTKGTQDKLTAAFFAPRFRESIINTLFNTGKAGVDFAKQLGGLRGKLNPVYKNNRKLLGGMIVSYGLYDALNYDLNGHHIWENPSGKEFALQIPSEDGTLTYVEFMPSFLAFARNLGSGAIALAKGDIDTAEQKFGSVFSMPFKITSEVISNQDYFGNPIYKDTDTGGQKALKIAKYVGLQVNHPYIKELVNQLQDKKPLYQSIVSALELPLRFSTKDKVSQSEFYDAMDKKAKENARATEKIRPIYEEIQGLLESGETQEAYEKYYELSDEERKIYKKIKTSEKRGDTISNESKIYTKAKEIKELKDNGQDEEAQALYDELTPDEKHAYNLVKDKI